MNEIEFSAGSWFYSLIKIKKSEIESVVLSEGVLRLFQNSMFVLPKRFIYRYMQRKL